jgi:hypothetical protein
MKSARKPRSNEGSGRGALFIASLNRDVETLPRPSWIGERAARRPWRVLERRPNTDAID